VHERFLTRSGNCALNRERISKPHGDHAATPVIWTKHEPHKEQITSCLLQRPGAARAEDSTVQGCAYQIDKLRQTNTDPYRRTAPPRHPLARPRRCSPLPTSDRLRNLFPNHQPSPHFPPSRFKLIPAHVRMSEASFCPMLTSRLLQRKVV